MMCDKLSYEEGNDGSMDTLRSSLALGSSVLITPSPLISISLEKMAPPSPPSPAFNCSPLLPHLPPSADLAKIMCIIPFYPQIIFIATKQYSYCSRIPII